MMGVRVVVVMEVKVEVMDEGVHSHTLFLSFLLTAFSAFSSA